MRGRKRKGEGGGEERGGKGGRKGYCKKIDVLDGSGEGWGPVDIDPRPVSVSSWRRDDEEGRTHPPGLHDVSPLPVKSRRRDGD